MTLHIAAVGDSHTNFWQVGSWADLLQEMLSADGIDAVVQNFGMPGSTVAEGTAGIPQRLEYVLQQKYPPGGELGAVILQGGTNDLAHFIATDESIDAYGSHGAAGKIFESPSFQPISAALERMCMETKAAGLLAVYWNIPPLGRDARLLLGGDIRVVEQQNHLRKLLDGQRKMHCLQNGIVHVDVAAQLSDADGYLSKEYDSGDGVHISQLGQGTVAAALFWAIKPVLA